MSFTLVISAFPGCGKTTCYKQNEALGDDEKLVMLDSDSSLFSWIYKDGKKTEERDPNFPKNYVDHIKENLGTADIIFVSSHANVRKALAEEGIEFMLVYPDIELKDQWMERFKARGNDDKFIQMMSDNWDNFITEMEGTDNYYCKLEKEDDIINQELVRWLWNFYYWHVLKEENRDDKGSYRFPLYGTFPE